MTKKAKPLKDLVKAEQDSSANTVKIKVNLSSLEPSPTKEERDRAAHEAKNVLREAANPTVHIPDLIKQVTRKS